LVRTTNHYAPHYAIFSTPYSQTLSAYLPPSV
jgi:hypothetical protein